MIDFFLFILIAPIVFVGAMVYLYVFVRCIVLTERLDPFRDKTQRVEVHHYHHAPPSERPHVAIVEPARPQIAAQRTVAYPVAAKVPFQQR